MNSHTRPIALLFIVLCVSIQVWPQSQAKTKKPLATVSGRITIKGKTAPGVVVMLRENGPITTPRGFRSTTNDEGVYRINEVPAGTYYVMPSAAAYIVSDVIDSRGKTLVLGEGETVDGVDFTLIKGGVITGKVTDSEHQPLVEERVSIYTAEAAGNSFPLPAMNQQNIRTDDRGVFRVFGLPVGHYKVAVGRGDDLGMLVTGLGARASARQTFYPDVTDMAKAAVIDVTEGSTAENIDIVVGRALDTFRASGRVLDGDSNAPLDGIRLMLQKSVNNRLVGNGVVTSITGGEFRLENLTAGSYSLNVMPIPDRDLRADPIQFQIVDKDVDGLVVKTSKGSGVSGMLVVSGFADKTVMTLLQQLRVYVSVRPVNQQSTGGVIFGHAANVYADGSFRAGGLSAGKVVFNVYPQAAGKPSGFVVDHVEFEGRALGAADLDLKDNEELTGVRVILNYGNATIRGVINFVNGELPQGGRVSLGVTRTGDPTKRLPGAPIDARNHFVVEGVPAGTYDVTATVFVPAWRGKMPRTVQQVTVTNGANAEVSLTLDLTPPPPPPPPPSPTNPLE